MAKLRVLSRMAASAAIALYALGLAAQNPPSADPVVWVDGMVVLNPNEMEPPRINVESANGKVARSIQAPSKTIGRDVLDKRLYALTFLGPQGRDAKAGVPSDFLFKIHERPLVGIGDWREVARWRNRYKGLVRIAKLENGDYLALTDRALFPSGGGFTPFAILTADARGDLSVKEALAIGLDQPVWKGTVDEYGHAKGTYPGLHFDFGTTFVRTPGHLVAVNEAVGWIFIFKARNGAFERLVRIFDVIDPNAFLSGRRFPYAGLGEQPRPGGNVLLATRSPEAIAQAAEAFSVKVPPEAVKDPSRLKAWYQETQPIRDENLRQFPFLSWWNLDPETGTLRPEPAPQSFPDRISNGKEMWNWNWRFKADGNLLSYPSPGAAEKESKTLGKTILGYVGIK